MGRRLVAWVPLLTVTLVGILVLWIGPERPINAARVWGGPTDRLAHWTGWIEASSRGAAEGPLANASLEVIARSAEGREIRKWVRLDAAGRVELDLAFGDRAPGAFELEVRRADLVLAASRVELTAERWRSKAGRRGGFYAVRGKGDLSLAAAPARGAFAVPFPGPLWVRVARAGRPLSGVALTLDSEGAEVRPKRLSSDARGIGVATLSPREHVVTLRARAESSELRGELVTSVPVVPGALVAELEGDVLSVASPLERDEAFITLVGEEGRYFGARVALTPDGRGGAVGRLKLPLPAERRLWAVVASDPTAASVSRVGWPLFELTDEPALTFDVADALLLDGFPRALEAERNRQRRVRRIALMVGLLGALLTTLSVVLSVRRSDVALDAELDRELDADAKARVAPTRRFGALLAIVLIILGFFVVALVTAWRLV